MMRVALYQPDIAANVGAILRLGACFKVPIDIIEPCGFPFDMRLIRRVALDYVDHVEITRYTSWDDFICSPRISENKVVLLSTQGTVQYNKLDFGKNDILLLGRESAGVTPEVWAAVDVSVHVPISSEMRSLNVASACGIVLGEALRQTDLFPEG